MNKGEGKNTHTPNTAQAVDIRTIFLTHTHTITTPKNDRDVDLYPPELRAAIDDLNAWVYEKINNGVYRVGAGAIDAFVFGMIVE